MYRCLMIAMFCGVIAVPSVARAADETSEQRLARLEQLVQEQSARIDELQAQQSDVTSSASGMGDHRVGNLHIAVRSTTVVQGTVNGDDAGLGRDPDPKTAAATVRDGDGDKADANLAFGLEIQAPVGDRGLVYLMLEGGQGDGLANDLATRYGMNDTVEEDDIEVAQLYYQHSFADGELILRTGMLEPDTLFDGNAYANNADTQFLSDSFVNARTIAFPKGDSGYGLDLSWAPTALVSASLGVYDGDGDWEDIPSDVFAIAEIGLHPVINSHPGNYRFYAWSNNDNDRLTWLDGDDELGWGVGLSFDQELSHALGVFVRYSYANENLYEVSQAWSGGLAFLGRAWGRENDMLGLAIGQSYLSAEYERTLPAGYDVAPETYFEIFYRWRINRALAISPDVQVVRNANGNARAETTGILGLRAQLDF